MAGRTEMIEFNQCKLVTITRKNDNVRNGSDNIHNRSLFRRIRGPRIHRRVVRPQGGERNRSDDELERRGGIHLNRE